MVSSRRRTLSEEDRALWRTVAKSLTPLKRRAPAKEIQEAAAPQADKVAKPQPAPPRARSWPAKSAQKPADKKPPVLAPISRKEKSRLSRGRQEIHARIDLHGMTQARAHRALLSFLRGAHADGATFVLVITGKGRVSAQESERGVLRRQVPLWFDLPEFRALIVGYEEAHIGHGGAGALYVRVRRARL